MLLAQVGGHVRVLALTHDSRAYVAGVRPGDEILAFGNGMAVGTLDDFIRGYIATKHQARVSGNPSYAMEIRESDSGQTASIQIAAPPSIPSFF
jgi:predicted metalloprotease with PDZ domain